MLSQSLLLYLLNVLTEGRATALDTNSGIYNGISISQYEEYIQSVLEALGLDASNN